MKHGLLLSTHSASTTHRSHELERHHDVDVALGDAQHVHILVPHGHVGDRPNGLHRIGGHGACLAVQHACAVELCCLAPVVALCVCACVRFAVKDEARAFCV